MRCARKAKITGRPAEILLLFVTLVACCASVPARWGGLGAHDCQLKRNNPPHRPTLALMQTIIPAMTRCRSCDELSRFLGDRLNPPPGAKTNSWTGKRVELPKNGGRGFDALQRPLIKGAAAAGGCRVPRHARRRDCCGGGATRRIFRPTPSRSPISISKRAAECFRREARGVW